LRSLYGRLFEFKMSKFRLLKNVRSVLKFSYAGCLGLSAAIKAQFTLKMCAAAEN